MKIMNNKKKAEKKLFTVRLNIETIKKLEEVSRERKKKNYVDCTIQCLVEEALRLYLK